MSEASKPRHPDALVRAERGMALCRRGAWEEGLELLAGVTESASPVALPAVVYSYLGHAIARKRGRREEGLSLCEYAVRADPTRPESFLNLTRVLLMMGRRERALGVLNRGLALDPQDAELLQARLDLGVRRSPVVSFLGRRNPVNRVLGRVRHKLRSA